VLREDFDGWEPIYYAGCSACGDEYYVGNAYDVPCEDKPYRCPKCPSSTGPPCSRCGEGNARWDLLGSVTVCFGCQEKLVLGEAEPLKIRLDDGSVCDICIKYGTVPYLTHQVEGAAPVRINLCPAHFRGYMGRRLDPRSYRALRARLNAQGFRPVFLASRLWYSEDGVASAPLPEVSP
jgi:hypothetical protein